MTTEINWPVRDPDVEAPEAPDMPDESANIEPSYNLLFTEGMSIGESIFAQVLDLEKQGIASKQEAFAFIADRTGRRQGTVAANFYRIAREKEGGAPKPQGRKGKGGRPRNAVPDTDVVKAGRQAVKALAALCDLAESQQAELRQLRKDAEKVGKLRTLLGTA